jgi:hypothetical protein
VVPYARLVLKNRSAVEIMVITFTFVLAFMVTGTGVYVAVAMIIHPTADVSTAISSLTSVVSAILAALLGLVAGKSDSLTTVQQRPEEEAGAYTPYTRPDEHPKHHKTKTKKPDPDVEDDDEEDDDE